VKAVRYRNASGEYRLGRLEDDSIVDAGPAGEQGFVPTRAAWEALAAAEGSRVPLDAVALAHPVVPRKLICIGLNYRDHAEESGFELPAEPLVFTKYASSFTGPRGDIALSPGDVDWEVELVAVIGTGGRGIAEADAWEHVAGLTLGQDISDRVTQFAAPPAQFGLGKSYPGFSPVGPSLVTLDELRDVGLDPADLELGCLVNGESVQKSRTSLMIFPIPVIIAKLSAIVTLLPGDVIFTGTPSGVGVGMNPPRFLRAGDELHTWCTGIGELRHRFVGC
jgi:2-keto-4-pentenoate hydratase/2-oxohepta-3-ene-1,7-dioic acid hydratase in catechol pathway